MPGQSLQIMCFNDLAKLEVLFTLNFTFPSLSFFCRMFCGESSTWHQDLCIVVHNVLCLFLFKPVKDQVLPP